MIRNFLLFGKLTEVESGSDFDNTEVILAMRDELKRMDSCYSFDMLTCNDYGTIVLMFMFEHHDPIIKEQGWTLPLTRLLTGEGVIKGYQLTYPIMDSKQPFAYSKRMFENLWRKNNNAVGGDDFKLVSLSATYTHLIAIIQFEGLEQDNKSISIKRKSK